MREVEEEQAMPGLSRIPWAKISESWSSEHLRRMAERRAVEDPDQLAEDAAIEAAYGKALAPLTDEEFAMMLTGGGCIIYAEDGEIHRRVLRPQNLA